MEITDNAGSFAYLNGELIKPEDKFEVDFQGNIIYEVVRFVDGQGVFLKDHYNRFLGSIKLAGMKTGLEFCEYKKACSDVIMKNGMPNNNIKLMYSSDDNGETCLVYSSKSFYPDKEIYKNGVNVAVSETERPNPNAKISRSDYIDKMAKIRSEQNVFEVLLMNSHGEFTEGGKSNLFFIKNNKVITAPSSMVLEGIMRKYVFEIASAKNIDIDDSMPMLYSELKDADAAFLTGTSINVLPIRKITGICEYDTQNPILKKIMTGFDERVREEWLKD